jgi:hypothetical protein
VFVSLPFVTHVRTKGTYYIEGGYKMKKGGRERQDEIDRWPTAFCTFLNNNRAIKKKEKKSHFPEYSGRENVEKLKNPCDLFFIHIAPSLIQFVFFSEKFCYYDSHVGNKKTRWASSTVHLV